MNTDYPCCGEGASSLLRQFVKGYRKGRRLALDASKGIYLGGTLLSILISLYLFTSGRRETGIFVGLWAPTVLNLGQTLLEDKPAAQPSWRERILRSK